MAADAALICSYGQNISGISNATIIAHEMATPAIAGLRKAITSRFSSEELRIICFDLGIEFSEIPPDATHPIKVIHIIEAFRRADRIPDLVAECNKQRPGFLQDSPLLTVKSGDRTVDQLIERLENKSFETLPGSYVTAAFLYARCANRFAFGCGVDSLSTTISRIMHENFEGQGYNRELPRLFCETLIIWGILKTTTKRRFDSSADPRSPRQQTEYEALTFTEEGRKVADWMLFQNPNLSDSVP